MLLDQIKNHKLKLNDFNMDNPLINNVIAKFYKNEVIGKGAVGKVYMIDNYVIKNINPCQVSRNKPLYQYCKDILILGKNKIPFIPTGNKYRYILPNLLTEEYPETVPRGISNDMSLARIDPSAKIFSVCVAWSLS